MTISEREAVQIARNFAASRALSGPYLLKDGICTVERRSSDTFSQSLGVDCTHWAITFELVVPEDVVVCPDELTILVSEFSGKATLATLM